MKKTGTNILSHVHTFASNGPASSLDRVISKNLRKIFTPIPDGLIWRECFTGVGELKQILDGQKCRRKIDLVFVTDHMSSRSHRLHPNLLRLACEDRRVGIGCELQTVKFCRTSEKFVTAPEVLVYGPGSPSTYHGLEYTGVNDKLIAGLYDECVLPGGEEPDIYAVWDFCQANNLACALAHPFDCHALSLEETLDVICRFACIEAVNGGFPKKSSQALCEYIAFHNDLLENGLPETLDFNELTEIQVRCIKRILQSECIVSLGGSDAHFSNFDRVITRCNGETYTSAMEFVAAMLEKSQSHLAKSKKIQPVGSGCSMTELYKDVFGVVGKNFIVSNRFFRSPAVWPRLAWVTCTTVMQELVARIRKNSSITAEFNTNLDIPRLQGKIHKLRQMEETVKIPIFQ